MLISHHLCTVECYRVGRLRPGAPRDEILLEGWFLSHAPVLWMRLVFSDGSVHEVSDRCRDSGDVSRHHGEAFGAASARCRFLLVQPTSEPAPDYGSAELHVRLEGGEFFVLALRRELRIVPGDDAAAWGGLADAFQSCGDGPELGAVQARLGSEAASLLRRAEIGDVFALSSAIENRFADLGRPGAIRMSVDANEWITHVPAAQLVFRTGRRCDTVDRERILAEETRTLASLAGRLIDDLEAARQIFGYRVGRGEHGGPDGLCGIDHLHRAMRTIGPARLLWVNTADDARADGTQADGTLLRLGDGLWRGWIDRSVPDPDAADRPIASWVTLLGEARRAMANADALHEE